MTRPTKRYTSDAIDVTYDVARCIHAAECVRGLPAVFDTAQRPWIQPANAGADAVAEVVMRCPTGALHFERHDGGTAEPVPDANRVIVTAAGPLTVRGDVRLELLDGALSDTRVALCRCGQSHNKPFCDNAHRAAGFGDPGDPATAVVAEMNPDGPLTITPSTNGPLLLRGRFELLNAAGTVVFRGQRAALCRCGGSANKPFCDGTHKLNQFRTETP